jgi:SAM-dependent methyltransferase
MEGATRYHGWVLSAFRGFVGRSVLEVGFGHGSVRSLLPQGTRYVGVDRDPEVVARARARFADGHYVEADIEDPAFAGLLAGAAVDTVLCVNVLEHIEDDQRAVRNLLGVLERGGHLLLFVPAFRALYNDLDRLAGHRRRYTRREVRDLVPEDLGVVRKSDYFNPLGAVGWWFNGLVQHRSLEGAAVKEQVRLFEALVLPLSRLLDPATRRMFGQSVACLVERR